MQRIRHSPQASASGDRVTDLRQHARTCAEQFDNANRGMSDLEREQYDRDMKAHRAGEPYPRRWTPDAGLCAAPGHMLAAHRELAAAGMPYIFQQGFGANPAVLATVIALDGVPLGSRYPFGQAAIIT